MVSKTTTGNDNGDDADDNADKDDFDILVNGQTCLLYTSDAADE